MTNYRYICKDCKNIIVYDPARLKWQKAQGFVVCRETQSLFCPYCGYKNTMPDIVYVNEVNQ